MSKEELDARSMKALMAIASSWYDQMKGRGNPVDLASHPYEVQY